MDLYEFIIKPQRFYVILLEVCLDFLEESFHLWRSDMQVSVKLSFGLVIGVVVIPISIIPNKI
jgi:hypothetical protein